MSNIMASKMWVENKHIIFKWNLRKKIILIFGSLFKVEILFDMYDDHFFSTNRHMGNSDPCDVKFF